MPKQVTIERFPGIDLRTDPGESAGALDAQNVVIDTDGVRVRGGLQTFIQAPARVTFMDRFQRASGAVQLITAQVTGGALGYQTVRSDGTLLASSSVTGVSEYGCSGAALGTLAAEYYFLTDGANSRRWDGSAWTTPGGTFPAVVKVFSLLPTEQRLVAITSADVVWFSDAGAPETYTSTNFLRLMPGDGERIQGATTYHNQTFIFKQTKFFVFYGTSTDVTGNPVFNYRTVNTGVGMYYPSPQSVCTAKDGVYFIGQDGVYRTTGNAPEKISRQLDPFWSQETSPFWQGGESAIHVTSSGTIPGRIVAVGDLLFVSVPRDGTTNVTFVYNIATKVWTMWNIVASAITPFPYGLAAAVTVTTDVAYFADSVNFKIGRYDPTATSDYSGTAIVSRYRAPFENYGIPNEKILKQTLVEGSGTPTLQWSRDWGSLQTGSAVTLGTDPALAVGRQRLAIRGRWFSFQVGAASGFWRVNRVEPILLGSRPAGVTV